MILSSSDAENATRPPGWAPNTARANISWARKPGLARDCANTAFVRVLYRASSSSGNVGLRRRSAVRSSTLSKFSVSPPPVICTVSPAMPAEALTLAASLSSSVEICCEVLVFVPSRNSVAVSCAVPGAPSGSK